MEVSQSILGYFCPFNQYHLTLFRILIFIFILPIQVWAQSDQRIGQWKSYMSHATGNFVTQSTDDIFFGTNGGLVIINKSNEEVRFVTKVEGLSDNSVQALAWDEKQHHLLIAYQNSNIDLYDPTTGEVINLPDILRNTRILGDRFIYRMHVPVNGEMAYLACGFGIVELNLTKLEFGFTAFTGVPVNEVTLYQDKIYAATESGVYFIANDKTRFNMSDFGQWSQALSLGSGSYQAIQTFNDLLYLGSGSKLLSWNGVDEAKLLVEQGGHTIQYLSSTSNLLLVGSSCKGDCDGTLLMVDRQKNISSLSTSCVPRPLYGIVDEQGRGWFADRFQAFRSNNKINEGCSFKYFNTPLSPYSTDIALYQDKVYVAAGGIDASYGYLFRGDGFFSLIDGIWRYYNRGNNKDIQKADLIDLYKMAIDPVDGTLYIGTYWGGLMQCNMDDPDKPVIKIFDKSNSSLQGTVGDAARTRIGGLTYDRQGNLWMSNYLAERPISVMKKDGSWKSFSTPSNTNLLACSADSVGYLWFSSIGQGLVVYDPGTDVDATSDDRYKIFTSSNSVLETNIINTIATDLDGSVWVGTNKGVFVFECGESIFESSCTGSKRVIVQQDLGGSLLGSEDVQCIAIDGANRKWFGTRHGILVLSASGDQLVHQYTIDNSPLYDDLITVLRYQASSGEMFIGTGNGIQSIRTEATAGGRSNQNSDIYAFPNPVRPEYQGPISIQGLRRNSYVKITDFGGHLVNEGKSNGGLYVWDGLDLSGRKVASGMYTVWISAGDGLEQPDTKIIKIAVVR